MRHAVVTRDPPNITIDDWAKKWRIKINQSKCTHITFTLCNQTRQTMRMGNVALPRRNEVKYWRMRLDRRMRYANRIKTKRKQLNVRAKQMHWLLGRRSTLPTE
jgi:hypothetical protein